MAKIISKKCGKGSCPFYDPHNTISHCREYKDRRLCKMSMSHRNKVSKISKKRELIVQRMYR